ncbi:MAG: gamma-glutamyl-gamma-aminobutyrate hydrolase family protein [Lachnospiraceae bacterium]|nr:gamma-glutamyl-gamma-aminobutyrate hydrolase family protein [Lachnospiraceae bacterium]
MGKPVIGVMPQYSAESGRIMVTANYFHAVRQAGGIPVLLPLFSECFDIEGILDRFDGFLFPGGPDINPLLFGEETLPECGNIVPERDTLELGLMSGILRSGKPVFGICRGIQVMNVALGGTLFQDIPSQTGEQKVGHYQKAGNAVLTHSVRVEKNTLLYDIVKKERITVNSFHHQSCKILGEGLVLNASAADGIIEAAALKNHRFFLGVQWHPEHLYGLDDAMTKVWDTFVGLC